VISPIDIGTPIAPVSEALPLISSANTEWTPKNKKAIKIKIPTLR
jgi:hypothetical protein